MGVCTYLCIHIVTQASILFQSSNPNCPFDVDQNPHVDVDLLSGVLAKSYEALHLLLYLSRDARKQTSLPSPEKVFVDMLEVLTEGFSQF